MLKEETASIVTGVVTFKTYMEENPLNSTIGIYEWYWHLGSQPIMDEPKSGILKSMLIKMNKHPEAWRKHSWYMVSECYAYGADDLRVERYIHAHHRQNKDNDTLEPPDRGSPGMLASGTMFQMKKTLKTQVHTESTGVRRNQSRTRDINRWYSAMRTGKLAVNISARAYARTIQMGI